MCIYFYCFAIGIVARSVKIELADALNLELSKSIYGIFCVFPDF